MKKGSHEGGKWKVSMAGVLNWNESRRARAKQHLARTRQHRKKAWREGGWRALRWGYGVLCILTLTSLVATLAGEGLGSMEMSAALAVVLALAPIHNEWWRRQADARKEAEERYERNREVFSKALEEVLAKCEGKEWVNDGSPVAAASTAAHNIVDIAAEWGWSGCAHYISECIARYERSTGRSTSTGGSWLEGKWPPIQVLYRFWFDEACQVAWCDVTAGEDPLDPGPAPQCRQGSNQRCLRRKEEELERWHRG